MNEKKKVKSIKLETSEDMPLEKEVQGIMNAIKDDQIQNGNIPRSSLISIKNFAGKVLSRDKSIVFKGVQYFLNKGIQWDKIEPFFRKHMKFSDIDFE